jgi:ABC-type multidrug transport system fused ATPase/permease subunit
VLNRNAIVALKMTSVERIMEYTALPSESLYQGTKQADEKWPQRGDIVFDNVSFSYDKSLPDVLRELTFRIGDGEKVGIVGRTGAGKSSLIQTLFRMAEPSGTILLDGVNIRELSLNQLRSRMSIIPVSARIVNRTHNRIIDSQ